MVYLPGHESDDARSIHGATQYSAHERGTPRAPGRRHLRKHAHLAIAAGIQAALLRRRAGQPEAFTRRVATPGDKHQARRSRADDRQLMGSDSVLKLDYLSRAELAERPASWWQNVLGVAAFDAAAPRAPS